MPILNDDDNYWISEASMSNWDDYDSVLEAEYEAKYDYYDDYEGPDEFYDDYEDLSEDEYNDWADRDAHMSEGAF
jgi:hypothetical protein